MKRKNSIIQMIDGELIDIDDTDNKVGLIGSDGEFKGTVTIDNLIHYIHYHKCGFLSLSKESSKESIYRILNIGNIKSFIIK